MKTLKRRLLGAVLVLAAIITGIGLQLLGIQMVSFHRQSATSSVSWDLEFALHWSVFLLIGLAFVGLLRILLPPREPV